MDSPGKKFALGILAKVGPKPKEEEPEGASEMQLCCEDLISAIEAKDPAGVESALRDAFAVMESEPHEETEPSEE